MPPRGGFVSFRSLLREMNLQVPQKTRPPTRDTARWFSSMPQEADADGSRVSLASKVKWHRRVILGLLCIYLSAGQARSEYDAPTFLQQYDAGDQHTQQMLRSYLLGVESGLGWAEAYVLSVRKQSPIQCRPPGLVLSGDQLLALLRKEVAEHPETTGKAHAGLALFAALRRAYPCRGGV
jgi:hypothetical protein